MSPRSLRKVSWRPVSRDDPFDVDLELVSVANVSPRLCSGPAPRPDFLRRWRRCLAPAEATPSELDPLRPSRLPLALLALPAPLAGPLVSKESQDGKCSPVLDGNESVIAVRTRMGHGVQTEGESGPGRLLIAAAPPVACAPDSAGSVPSCAPRCALPWRATADMSMVPVPTELRRARARLSASGFRADPYRPSPVDGALRPHAQGGNRSTRWRAPTHTGSGRGAAVGVKEPLRCPCGLLGAFPGERAGACGTAW